MREIKFRAWDKSTQHMIHEVSVHRNEEGDINPWEFMQFTGLRDKNGKEIYEGDIVKNGLGRTYVIESCVDGFHCVDDGFIHMFSVLNQNCEVIGNIHENTELVKNGSV